MRALSITARCLLATVVVGALLAAPAGAASPRGSVLDACDFTVTGNVAPGETVTVEGTGFQPDAELGISVNGTVVTTVVIGNGGVLPPTQVTIPADAESPIVISIPCSLGGGSGVATSVFGAADGGAGLADTGSSTSTIVAVGLGALVAGGVLMVGARRRAAVRTRRLGA